jgi:uroporphyrin-III C-methyltransferase
MKPGRVYLVGAGPGDPELLTFKAARVIGLADVLMVDDLVDPRVLSHARTDARVVYVGKRGGCASTPQAFISKLIVSEAKHGHTVVRVKGGDPSVFGRAAEEINAICAAGIDYEVVPGITSASAAAAQLGMPLTNRAFGHGVALVTGHTADEVDDDAHWCALVASGLTLVIYMGVSRCEPLVATLLRAGASGKLPCAVVQAASRADARSLHTTLAHLPTTIEREAITSPALLIIGSVAAQQHLLAPPIISAPLLQRRAQN